MTWLGFKLAFFLYIFEKSYVFSRHIIASDKFEMARKTEVFKNRNAVTHTQKKKGKEAPNNAGSGNNAEKFLFCFYV